MKFSQLALIGVVSAVTTPPATPKCSVTKNPAVAADLKCTCDTSTPDTCLTETNKTALADKVKALKTEGAKLVKAADTVALKEALDKTLEAEAKKSIKATEAAKKLWDTCSKAAEATATKDKKPVIIDGACEADLLTYLEAEAEVKQEAVVAVKANGAVIGIIVGCCVGLCLIGGGVFWYCKHKKAKENAFNHDDLYEAFVDNDQA
jgi:hypothetical protein